jgi:prepilin peptidase CpaA
MIVPISAYILFIFLGIAAIFDLFLRRVPNYWTGIGAGIGMAAPWLTSYGVSMTSAYLGGVLAFSFFLVPYVFGWMGAGDVKLFGASGLFIGMERVIAAALYIAIAGGVLAVIFLSIRILRFIQKRNLGEAKHWHDRDLPYAVAIFGGTVALLFKEISQ